jgi:hypothetical protein
MIAANPQPATERGALGQVMYDRRTYLGYSQPHAAGLAGVSLARWRQLELGYECLPDGGRKTPGTRPSTLRGIAHALKLPTREVFEAAGVPFDPNEPPPPAETENKDRKTRFLTLLNGLSPAQQEGIEAVLVSMQPHRPYDDLPQAS